MAPKKIVLPKLLERKIYKTGQTRGADDDEIYQNRVGRNSTILIPFNQYSAFTNETLYRLSFEHGFIVLIAPNDYDNAANRQIMDQFGLELGRNMLVFYETREQWNARTQSQKQWEPASSRIAPLGGQYVARIPATTAAADGAKITRGFSTTQHKGAGIRAYEYASSEIIRQCRIQLESIFWHCRDAIEIAEKYGMSNSDAAARMASINAAANAEGLLDYGRLVSSRILNREKTTICPLCLEAVSAEGFFSKMEQAEGREVVDLTITQLNLFHIEELRYGIFNHKPYNIGWGHHHCNVVVKDSGIRKTLQWMAGIVAENQRIGYLE